jgi:glucosylceramidase
MDFPPDWILTDVNDKARQTIAPKFYDSLSLYYLKYVQAYEQHGITIDYLSPFNEPGAYSKVSYEQIRDLIKDHLGPLLANSGTKTRLQASDAPFRAHARHGIPTIMMDPRARQYIASLSYHGYDYRFRTSAGQSMSMIGSVGDLRDAEPTAKDGYGFQEFRNIEQLHAMYSDLPLWMTEVCYFDMEHSNRKPWQPSLPRYDFDDGDFWGLQIAADMAAGASGWTYWNMVLDQNGGPNLVSPSHNNPARNVQHPVVIINRETGKVTYTGLYYYLAHFSRFVRPGANRIGVDGEVDGITMLGFEGPDRRITIEAINSRNTPANLRLGWHDGVLHLQMPARSISTYTWSEPQQT